MNMDTRTKLEVLAVIIAAVAFWWVKTPSPPPAGQTVPATQSPVLNDVPKEDVHPPKVSVFKPAAKIELGLPQNIQDDQDLQVIGSSLVNPDTHSSTVTTVINTKTGDTETLVRRDPYPWLAAEQHGEARIDYGVRSSYGTVARMSISENLLQVKALHFGVSGSLDTGGQAFIGAGVAYRW